MFYLCKRSRCDACSNGGDNIFFTPSIGTRSRCDACSNGGGKKYVISVFSGHTSIGAKFVQTFPLLDLTDFIVAVNLILVIIANSASSLEAIFGIAGGPGGPVVILRERTCNENKIS